MEKGERRWVILFAGVVMLFTTVPYLVGYASQGNDWRFTGFVFGVEDGNSYIAKMLSGAAGAWLFRTPYTAYPQRGQPMFLPYLWLGKLASPPAEHDQLVALFHLYRIAAGVLVTLAAYEFISLFLRKVRLRRWGLVLITLGGGLGWFLILIGRSNLTASLPLEMYSPESFGFLELYGLPHLALARAAMFWGLATYLKPYVASQGLEHGLVEPWAPRAIRLGVAGLVAFLAQPLTAALMWVVIGLHQAILLAGRLFHGQFGTMLRNTRIIGQIRVPVVAGLVSLPLAVYSAAMLAGDPFMKSWAAQNVILSPAPLQYLVAYGLILPLVVWGAVRLLRIAPAAGWLPAAWLIAVPALVYAPINIQRRLAEGIWVVMVTLALIPWEYASVRGAPRIRFGVFQVASLLVFPSTLMLLAGGIFVSLAPSQPIFQPAEQVSAYEYLAHHAPVGSVVLASFDTSNALPAWAPVRVLIGHGPESMNLSILRPRVEAFYQSTTSDSSRVRLLREFGVDYVVWGEQEAALGSWDPQNATYLKLTYRSGDCEVFAVDLKGG